MLGNSIQFSWLIQKDPYPQFRIVIQFFRFLTATKRLGQAHGIDSILSHRPPKNLLLFCCACSEPHVNMEDGWQQTPPELRQVIIVLGCLCHFLISFARRLNQTQDTADGNHHVNKYMKKTDRARTRRKQSSFSSTEPCRHLSQTYSPLACCGRLSTARWDSLDNHRG